MYLRCYFLLSLNQCQSTWIGCCVFVCNKLILVIITIVALGLIISLIILKHYFTFYFAPRNFFSQFLEYFTTVFKFTCPSITFISWTVVGTVSTYSAFRYQLYLQFASSLFSFVHTFEESHIKNRILCSNVLYRKLKKKFLLSLFLFVFL